HRDDDSPDHQPRWRAAAPVPGYGCEEEPRSQRDEEEGAPPGIEAQRAADPHADEHRAEGRKHASGGREAEERRQPIRSDEQWGEARRLEQRVRPHDATQRTRRCPGPGAGRRVDGGGRLASLRLDDPIEANRVLDVLELPYAEVLERDIELLVNLLVDG